MKNFSIPIVFLLFFISANLSAQESIEMMSKTKGISAGIYLGYISFADDKYHPATDNGLGFGGHIQYGFNHKIAIDFSVQQYSLKSNSNNNIDDNNMYPYTEIDIIGKYLFGSSSTNLRPFLEVGFNHTRVIEELYFASVNLSTIQKYIGYGFCFGGGLSYFVKPEISIDLNLLIHSGDFVSTIINGDDSNFEHGYFSYSGLAGASYHF